MTLVNLFILVQFLVFNVILSVHHIINATSINIPIISVEYVTKIPDNLCAVFFAASIFKVHYIIKQLD